MAKERYKPTPADVRMDKLLESRDLFLGKIHALALAENLSPKGLIGFLDAYERTSNLIDRIENAHAGDKAIVIRFERVKELEEMEKDDEKD
jgi:hypothetical protein